MVWVFCHRRSPKHTRHQIAAHTHTLHLTPPPPHTHTPPPQDGYFVAQTVVVAASVIIYGVTVPLPLRILIVFFCGGVVWVGGQGGLVPKGDAECH